MPMIHVLSPHVTNQIAAGEVVERPASVVKELVENAVDAGASAITVEIENGGIDLIRVCDNGCGIPPEDCEKAFLRHATSKISTVDDISRIQTLGFRGEALPSIASVASVTMHTRTKGADCGTLFSIDNGAVLENGPCACTEGTSVDVVGLFSQTPARLKFLKGARAEAGAIGDYLSRMIMALPEISFHYMNQGKTVYQTYGDGKLQNALFAVYGSEVLPYLRDVQYDDGYIRVSGYIGTPEIARPNRTRQSLYLNGRYIRSNAVSMAMLRAFDTRLMTGRFPFAVLFLRLAAGEVDVNVHPSKMEVRFLDERRVTTAVYDACLNALMDTPPLTSPQDFAAPTTSEAETSSNQATGTIELRSPFPKNSGRVAEAAATAFPRWPGTAAAYGRETKASGWSAGHAAAEVPYFRIPDNAPVQPPMERAETVRLADAPYRVVGAAFAGYWIVEQGDALFIIDQHAAHERKLYEQLCSREAQPAAQTLLVAEVLRLQPSEYAELAENLPELTALGFQIELTPETLSASIRAVPQLGGKALGKEFLLDAVQMLASTGKTTSAALRREALMQTACKHAVKVSEHIDSAEIEQLLNDYIRGGIPMTCPHGRPVMVRMTKREIEKLFKRVL